MKVQTYIFFLTGGSLLGALLIAFFGWFTFGSLRDATQSLEEESKNSGSSSEEFSVVQALLDTTRNVFTTMEIYPRDYPGVFNVAYDSLTLSKESINILSDKYFSNYSDEALNPLSKSIRELEDILEAMQKMPNEKEGDGWENRSSIERKKYKGIRESLKNDLDNLELNAQRNLAKANESLKLKWQELEEREANTTISLIVAIIIYLILVSVLAFLT